jgi:DNA-binding NarL/FixJ family response regulator
MRIVLADGRSKVRYAVRVLLEGRHGLEVAAEAGDVKDLMNKLDASCPDVILIDWDLPGLNKSKTMQRLRDVCPKTHVIVMSGRPEASHEAVDAGIENFIHKTSPPELLLSMIERCRQAES